jgi:hypothetical protein
MKTPMAIMIVLLVLVQIVYGISTITDVRWNANLKVIEILFDKFPAKWGGWTMYVDGNQWPMEGGPGKAVVRPNAAIGSATGLFVGTEPWLSDLEKYTFLVVELFSFLCLAKVLPIHFNMISLKRDVKQRLQRAAILARNRLPLPIASWRFVISN